MKYAILRFIVSFAIGTTVLTILRSGEIPFWRGLLGSVLVMLGYEIVRSIPWPFFPERAAKPAKAGAA